MISNHCFPRSGWPKERRRSVDDDAGSPECIDAPLGARRDSAESDPRFVAEEIRRALWAERVCNAVEVQCR